MNGIYAEIRKRWDAIAKPLDSLGKLEDIIARLGAVQGTVNPKIDTAAVIVFCSDNGIVEAGISQSDQSVTRICAENIGAGKTTVGIMAAQSNMDVVAVDVGVNWDAPLKTVINRKVRSGTRNFLVAPAMTMEEMESAISTGLELAAEYKTKGYDLLCAGEMGIGNTTTTAAVAAALLKLTGRQVCGRGAGLSDAGLQRKIQAVDTAIEKYQLYGAPVRQILSCVGGFDIAAMAGLYMGAKRYGIPVVLDGAISQVAALCAELMEPGTVQYLIPSHMSREPVCQTICSRLGIWPVLDAGMALGEGTGAVLMVPVLRTALAVYRESVRFENSGVDQYERFNS